MSFQSEQIDELCKSLSKAQACMTVAIEDKRNPHFKSTYASLNSIWNSCRDALTKEGLSVVQTMEPQSEAIYLVTTLLHSSGQWIKSTLPISSSTLTPQQLGSAITYLRRYSLAAIVGVAPGEDDDAETVKNENIAVRKNTIPTVTINEIAKFKTNFGIGKNSPHEQYLTAISKRCGKNIEEMITLAASNINGFLDNFSKWDADIKKKEIVEEVKPVEDPKSAM